MRSHFGTVGAPLRTLSSYPTRNSISSRMKNAGWKFVGVESMNHFYVHILSSEERGRIADLEPFDEMEMWHQKCAHYVVALSTNTPRLWNSLLASDFPKLDHHYNNIPREHGSLEASVSQTRGCQRFAHTATCVELNERKYAILIGGIGAQLHGSNGQHSRLKEVIALDLGSYEAHSVEVQADRSSSSLDLKLDRCYHCAVPIGKNKVGILFGRLSPLKPLVDMVVLSLCVSAGAEGTVSATARAVKLDSLDEVEGRWRASSCLTTEGSIFVCGGLTLSSRVSRECLLICLESGKVRKLPDLPFPLHSHSLVSRGEDVLLLGGLKELDAELSFTIWKFDFLSWTPLVTVGSSNVVGYGMSCSLLPQDKILLVGGGSYYEAWNGSTIKILSFSSEQFTVDHVDLKYNTERPVELVNHSSFQESGFVIILGGGGNCFSFGTLFNPGTVKLKCADFSEQ